MQVLYIPGLLSPSSEFFKVIISKDREDPIFDSLALSCILKYKWDLYAKK